MKKSFLGYHGTNQKSFHYIRENGFKKTVSDSSFPNDLGRGAYFYVNRGSSNDEAIGNARKYVKKYKYDYVAKIILKVPVSVDEDKILDFNDLDAAASLESFIVENKDAIDSELDKFDKMSKAFNRGNFDGIAIDLFIDYFNVPVHIVLKDTFTNFGTAKISNFCNGREMCVKYTEAISMKDIKIENAL